jgi:hypothetical protein
MHQAAPAPPPEHTISPVLRRGRRILPRLRGGLSALGPGPRKGVLLAGVSIFLLAGPGSLASSTTLPGVNWSSLAWQPAPTPSPAPRAVTAQVQAFYQGDPAAGWDSPEQYQAWWPSACSPAALTMDLRAWGTEVGIGPVLDHLIALQAISPEQGLQNADALSQVARAYGYQALTFWHWTKQQVMQVTTRGVPVLVDVVDAHRQTRYPGLSVGHWLVVVGGAADGSIRVKDSSGYHIQQFSPNEFQILFTGIGIVVWSGAPALP